MRVFNETGLNTLKDCCKNFYKVIAKGLPPSPDEPVSPTEPAVVRLWQFRFFDLLTIVVVLAASVYLGWFFECNQIVEGDQMQMISKGYHAAMNHEFIPFGNEASTVGNVPGTLSSLLVGLPLIIKLDPMSPVYLLIFLRTAGALLFLDALRQLRFPSRVVVAGFAIYALNPWYMYDFLLYNPSYLSFGAALFLNMLVRLRSSVEISKRCRFWLSFILTMAAGFCLQLHYSWPVLVVMAAVLLIRRDIKISYAGVLAAAGIIVISLIPYFIEVLNNEAIRTNDAEYTKERYFGYGAVHVYPLLKALLYWLRFGSLLVTQKALIDELPSYLPFYFEIAKYLWIVITQIIGVLTLIVSVIANYKVLVSLRHTEDQSIRFMRGVVISSLIALIAAAAAATLVLNYWQIIILFPFALLPVIIAVSHNDLWRMRHLWLLMTVMVCFNVVSAISSNKFSVESSYVNSVNTWCVSVYGEEKCQIMPEPDVEEQSIGTDSNF